MAVSKLSTKCSMKIKVATGFDDAGNPIYATRNYSGVDPEATIENVYNAGAGLASLQKNTLDSITRVESSPLGSDAE